MNAKTLIHARQELWNYDVSLMIGQRNENGHLAVAQPLVFQDKAPGEIADPCIRLAPEDAQLLMDELWNVGIRPSEGRGSAGAMAATERHLKDMQEIAMGALKKAGVT
jgi:hypothetical protein